MHKQTFTISAVNIHRICTNASLFLTTPAVWRNASITVSVSQNHRLSVTSSFFSRFTLQIQIATSFCIDEGYNQLYNIHYLHRVITWASEYLFQVHPDWIPIRKEGDLKKRARRQPTHQQLYNQFHVLSKPLFVHTPYRYKFQKD